MTEGINSYKFMCFCFLLFLPDCTEVSSFIPPKMPPSFSSVSQDDTVSVCAGNNSLCSVQQARMFYV
jgi:hypothetical protein